LGQWLAVHPGVFLQKLGGGIVTGTYAAPSDNALALDPVGRFGAATNVDSSREAGRLKVMLVGSGGGHWVQLMRVASAFSEHDCVYVTTVKGCERDAGGGRLHLVTDANRWERFKLVRLAMKMLLLVLRERPHVIVSTGAAPGYFALRFGKMVGARTVWLDSVANVEKLSMSGEMVGKYADLWLTQWPHLARPEGPFYEGAVL
jgi:UDP-N-acetylglucosamine:LPS N-acetylglucosamine transferase